MTKHKYFRDDGFGWICINCNDEIGDDVDESPSRLLREGEAESNNPQLANRALARWADPARRTLVCPRCGITELIDIS